MNSTSSTWTVVPQLTATSSEPPTLAALSEALQSLELPVTCLQAKGGAQAVRVPFGPLWAAATHGVAGFSVLAKPERPVEEESSLLILSSSRALTPELLQIPSPASASPYPLRWVAWPHPPASELPEAPAREAGIQPAGGILEFRPGGAPPLVFDLYQMTQENAQRARLQAGARKVPEDPEALRRRAEWFQRRSGGSN